MAINVSRLFTSIGKLCGALNETNTFRGTCDTRQTTVLTQFGTANARTSKIFDFGSTDKGSLVLQPGELLAVRTSAAFDAAGVPDMLTEARRFYHADGTFEERALGELS